VRKQVGHIEIDTIAAERSKFTAPMVLVHGLWCTSSVWRRFMGYLAHRGWDCHAVNLRGRSSKPTLEQPAPASTSFADHLEDLNTVLESCNAPPIVVGHDLGGLLALSSSVTLSALVALSPLLPASRRDSPLPGFTNFRARIALRWRNRLPPPAGDVRRRYFGITPPQSIVPEAAPLARDLCNPSLPFPLAAAATTLIVVGDADMITPVDAATELATDIGAEVLVVPDGGHALPWENGWQERVTEVHRWLIRTLGDPLLVTPEEEE
jgi:pimeloyl-ACP methyl ester carboxylesterase